ncbi:MAG TPA: hypothetical protein VM597_16240 [Gemmataceae bacterium]|jgi:hypothetical protein|nr:hypothetical protein [Gemmataceae bacterium]
MTQESRDGPTPNGGVRSTIYYLDDAGNPADKESATRCEIVEYDAQGNSIHRTHATLNR